MGDDLDFVQLGRPSSPLQEADSPDSKRYKHWWHGQLAAASAFEQTVCLDPQDDGFTPQVVELDATTVGSIVQDGKKHHAQIFGLWRRPQDECDLIFNVCPLPLGTTTLKATPTVEDLGRVLRCGGLECIDKRRCEAIVTDGAELYPRIGDSLGLPHFHVNHSRCIWRKQFLRRFR